VKDETDPSLPFLSSRVRLKEVRNDLISQRTKIVPGVIAFAGTGCIQKRNELSNFVRSHEHPLYWRILPPSLGEWIQSVTPDGRIDFHGTYDEYLVHHPLPERERKGNWQATRRRLVSKQNARIVIRRCGLYS